MLEIPTFQGTAAEQIPNWVAYIDHAVQRKRWSNEDYQTKMGKRTAYTILAEGDTGYMGPCYDLTLATATLALATTKDPVLVIEELENRRYGYLLHFALEIDGGFVEYATCNTVFTGPGAYPGTWKKEDKQLATHRLVLQHEHCNQQPEEILQPPHYPRYNLTERIHQVMHDNTEETWQLYLKALAKEPHLTIKYHPRF